MSDFGAGTCDFHSDFASDFHTKGNDYAGDFGGEPRTAKQPPETTETAPPEHGTFADKAAGAQGRRQAGSAPRKRKATEQGTTPRHKAANEGHRTRGATMANRAYSRKAAGIHQQQRKTPHSVSHAGRWLFGKLCQVVQDKNRGKQDHE